jgi:GNAT superfamily N-acetyltransferase
MENILFYFDKPLEPELIADTFQKSFGSDFNIKTWEWRFLNNPFTEKVYINYIKVNNVLASYYAVSPVNLIVDGQTYKIALSNMTMTHPDHQGKGYFKLLATALYGKLKEDGFIGVFGFANQNSHYGFRKNLGWIDLTGLSNFSLEKNEFRSNLLNNKEEYIIAESAIDLQLIQKSKNLICSELKILPDRSVHFLNWRLLSNPSKKYHSLTVKTGDALIGVMFFKFYNGSIDIMEWFYAKHISIDQKLLLMNAISHLINKFNVNVNIWSNLHSEEHLLLEKFGFKESNFLTYFGVIPFVSEPVMTNLRDWHYRFIDSDVF